MFEQLGLIGCGLMGGSFALALKQAGLVQRVVGYSKSPSTTDRARQLGVIDVEAPSALLAVAGADIVLLAVPVSATEATQMALIQQIDPVYVNATQAVTDVARLRKAAEGRERVLFATGHPGGLLDVHRATAAALRTAGCEIVVIPDGLQTDEGYVMQFADVAVLEHGATLWHTHSGEPMRAILTGLERAGRPLPDLVVADHGWAGYAAQHGLDSVGYADCNDPALFLAESEGTLQVAVPLDDHVVSPRHYDPMTAYLLAAAGLTED